MEQVGVIQDGERVRVIVPYGYTVIPATVRLLQTGSAGTIDPLDMRTYIDFRCERLDYL